MFNFWDFQTLCFKVLAFIRKSFWPSRQNCNLLVQKNNLLKFSFESFRLFESLLIFYKSFAAILQESFRQFCPNCILPVKRKLLEDFFWNCFCQNVFRFWAKNFQTFGKRNCGGVFETVFYLSGRKFWKKSSSEKFCFHSLNISIAWAKLFLEFWLKTVGRLVETAFHVSRGTFREKFFQVRKLESLNIFRNWTEEFSTLTRNFRQFRQNCNLPVQKNILIKSIFFERITFSKLLSDF